MKISLNKILNIIFLLFVIIISIDPTGSVLGFKEILFVFLVFSSLFLLKGDTNIPKDCILILLICISLPVMGILSAIVQNKLTDYTYAAGHLKSFLFVFIFFFLITIDFKIILKALFISGSIIAICTAIIFFIAQINEDIFKLIYDHSIESSNIIITTREYYGISVFGVYFKTGPFMFFSYIYSLYFYSQKKLRTFFILTNLFALLIAGSRTPTLIALFISIIYLYDRLKNNRIFRYFVVLFSILLLGFVTLKLATEKGETSNDIKYADFHSYIKEFSNGTTLLFGDGLGSEFYSQGKSILVSFTEQTYMDIFRIYGIFLGTILIFIVIYPIIIFIKSKYYNNKKLNRFVIGYALYMILAGTNPLLISSTGMFIFATGITLIYKIKNNLLEKEIL